MTLDDWLFPGDYRFACFSLPRSLADTWCNSVEIYDPHQDNHFEEEDATIFEVDFHIEVPQLR